MNISPHTKCAITGAGSGIGRELALNLAQRGCSLSLSDVNLTGLQETLELCAIHQKKHASTIIHAQVDVTDKEQMRQWAQRTADELGGINLVINNAGVALGCPIEDMSYPDFERVMNINFWGMVYGTKEFLPLIKQSQDQGHIVNISSIYGWIGIPTQAAYNASKFAIRGYTECLRIELEIEGCNVSTTSVHPGGIKTNVSKSAVMRPELSRLGIDMNTALQSYDRFLIMPADKAAQVIIKAVEKNKRHVFVGIDAKFIAIMTRFMPSTYQILVRWLFKKQFARKN